MVVNPVTVVDADIGLVIDAAVPLTCVHAYDIVVPPLPAAPVPVNVTWLVGKIIV